MKRLLFLLPAFLILVSCGSKAGNDISEIEDALYVSPDSALILLQQYKVPAKMDEAELTGYVIVRGKVLRANSMRIPYDSLGVTAARNFKLSYQMFEKLHVCYFLAVSELYGGYPENAILDFANTRKALEESYDLIDITDPSLPAEIEFHTAKAYEFLGDSVMAAHYLQKSNELIAADPELEGTTFTSFDIPAVHLEKRSEKLLDSSLWVFHKFFREMNGYTRIVAVFAAIIVLSVIAILLVLRYHGVKHRRIERKIDMETLDRYAAGLVQMNESMNGVYHANEMLVDRGRSLIYSRFDVVNNVCDIIYRLKGTASEKSQSYRQLFLTVSEQMTSEENLKKIINDADHHFDFIYSRLVTEIPTLSDIEKRIFLYTLIGLNARSISVLLNITVETVYNKKGYLKRKLRQSFAPSKEEFLRLL